MASCLQIERFSLYSKTTVVSHGRRLASTMTPPRTRIFFRRLLEPIRLAVHGGVIIHPARCKCWSSVSTWLTGRACVAVTITTHLHQLVRGLRKYHVLSLPLFLVVAAVFAWHQAVHFYGPPALLTAANIQVTVLPFRANQFL